MQFTEGTDPLLSWLGVVFALLVGAQLRLPTGSGRSAVLNEASTLTGAVFVADFGLKCWLAPRNLRFPRAHWLQLLGLLAPTLRLLSFLRLARQGRALPVAGSSRSSPSVSWAVSLTADRTATYRSLTPRCCGQRPASRPSLRPSTHRRSQLVMTGGFLIVWCCSPPSKATWVTSCSRPMLDSPLPQRHRRGLGPTSGPSPAASSASNQAPSTTVGA